MKILTLCEGGTVRSVSLARVLKDEEVDGRSHDAIAVSWRWNDTMTLDMLYNWAELIVIMEQYMEKYVPEFYRYKMKLCDVGPDVYGHCFNKELVARCQTFARAEGL